MLLKWLLLLLLRLLHLSLFVAIAFCCAWACYYKGWVGIYGAQVVFWSAMLVILINIRDEISNPTSKDWFTKVVFLTTYKDIKELEAAREAAKIDAPFGYEYFQPDDDDPTFYALRKKTSG